MITNIDAAKKLQHIYENMTEEQIKIADRDLIGKPNPMSDSGIQANVNLYESFNAYALSCTLTGLGRTTTCSLCTSVSQRAEEGTPRCTECVWSVSSTDHIAEHNCHCGDLYDTFFRIRFSDTPKEMAAAYRSRAKQLKRAIELAEQMNSVGKISVGIKEFRELGKREEA